MPILATGKPHTVLNRHTKRASHARGFTLLEIMLVMAVMAVMAAFVLPNLFRPAEAGLKDASRHMVRLLHLAGEEAQLRGQSLRWKAYADHYVFELADERGQWQTMNEPPFDAQMMNEGVSIAALTLAEGIGFYDAVQLTAQADGAAGFSDATGQGEKTDEGPLLGTVVFRSDGMLSIADLSLHAVVGDVLIQLRPGPAGIRVVEAQP
ncbi:MAG: prepilin-type N-terminal cleavage/methylation domain-containing protein [Mariprofundaceae bacterium]|nr:prepilin-type N-terminal cleavage/methylation domain-containing protein [Mariprofundaceae bacterium]